MTRKDYIDSGKYYITMMDACIEQVENLDGAGLQDLIEVNRSNAMMYSAAATACFTAAGEVE